MWTLICSRQVDVSYIKGENIMKWMHKIKVWRIDWKLVLAWGKYQVATYFRLRQIFPYFSLPLHSS